MKNINIHIAILLALSTTVLNAAQAISTKEVVETTKKAVVAKTTLVNREVRESTKNKKELKITTQKSLDNSLRNRKAAYDRRQNLTSQKTSDTSTSHRDEISAKRVKLDDTEK